MYWNRQERKLIIKWRTRPLRKRTAKERNPSRGLNIMRLFLIVIESKNTLLWRPSACLSRSSLSRKEQSLSALMHFQLQVKSDNGNNHSWMIHFTESHFLWLNISLLLLDQSSTPSSIWWPRQLSGQRTLSSSQTSSDEDDGDGQK